MKSFSYFCSMYQSCVSVNEIQSHFCEMYKCYVRVKLIYDILSVHRQVFLFCSAVQVQPIMPSSAYLPVLHKSHSVCNPTCLFLFFFTRNPQRKGVARLHHSTKQDSCFSPHPLPLSTPRPTAELSWKAGSSSSSASPRPWQPAPTLRLGAVLGLYRQKGGIFVWSCPLSPVPVDAVFMLCPSFYILIFSSFLLP